MVVHNSNALSELDVLHIDATSGVLSILLLEFHLVWRA